MYCITLVDDICWDTQYAKIAKKPSKTVKNKIGACFFNDAFL